MCGLLHLVQRGGSWAGCGPAQSSPRCTKYNSPPINSQCTNHCIAVWRDGPLLCCFNVAIKALSRVVACTITKFWERKWQRIEQTMIASYLSTNPSFSSILMKSFFGGCGISVSHDCFESSRVPKPVYGAISCNKWLCCLTHVQWLLYKQMQQWIKHNDESKQCWTVEATLTDYTVLTLT